MQLINLALNRPATQSSTSQWSKSADPEIDARGANNGYPDGEQGCHTAQESWPWWQVELPSISAISEVRLYNRRHAAFRLKRFTILASLDGEYWAPVFSKKDKTVFGSDKPVPYVAKLDTVARFVRVRLDANEFLHLSECEVIGRQVSSEEESSVTQFQQTVERIGQESRARLAAFTSGRDGRIVIVGAANVFVDTTRYSPLLVDALSSGRYEQMERRLVEEFISPTDRVLEVGTAVGAVTMAAAEIVGPENVVTFEANPQIAEDARKNFVYNQMGSIQSKVGILCNRLRRSQMPKTIDFHISRDFWASRIQVGQHRGDIIATVPIETLCLEDEVGAHRATVIISDIEGGETDLFFGADLSGIRLIIMEVHEPFSGRAPMVTMLRWLHASGFVCDPYFTERGIVLLTRS